MSHDDYNLVEWLDMHHGPKAVEKPSAATVQGENTPHVDVDDRDVVHDVVDGEDMPLVVPQPFDASDIPEASAILVAGTPDQEMMHGLRLDALNMGAGARTEIAVGPIPGTGKVDVSLDGLTGKTMVRGAPVGANDTAVIRPMPRSGSITNPGDALTTGIFIMKSGGGGTLASLRHVPECRVVVLHLRRGELDVKAGIGMRVRHRGEDVVFSIVPVREVGKHACEKYFRDRNGPNDEYWLIRGLGQGDGRKVIEANGWDVASDHNAGNAIIRAHDDDIGGETDVVRQRTIPRDVAPAVEPMPLASEDAEAGSYATACRTAVEPVFDVEPDDVMVVRSLGTAGGPEIDDSKLRYIAGSPLTPAQPGVHRPSPSAKQARHVSGFVIAVFAIMLILGASALTVLFVRAPSSPQAASDVSPPASTSCDNLTGEARIACRMQNEVLPRQAPSPQR